MSLDPNILLGYLTNGLFFLIGLMVTWMISSWTSSLVIKSLSKRSLDANLSSFFGKLAKWVILIAGFVSCLGIVGVQTASFAAVFAAIGFAVGMALQGTLGNFAAGVMLLFFKPIKTGSVVKVSGVLGTVSQIDLFAVAIDTPDHRRIWIPNNSVFGSQIEVINFHDTRRVDVAVGTDYSDDIDQTRNILLTATKSLENVLQDPAPAIILTDLGASSVNWSVRVWTETPNFGSVKDALTRSIKYSLDKEGIGIPYPQMELHMPANVTTLQ